MPRSSAPVVVVGAGLAGLIAARELARAGQSVRLLESADRPGGRMTTDLVQGFRIDRGFQVLNTGYPEVASALDVGALDLKAFTRGALVRSHLGRHLVADPRQQPRALRGTLTAPVGTLRDKAILAAVTGGLVAREAAALRPSQTTTLDRWRDRGVSPALVEHFLRPFLSGVLLDRDLGSDSRFGDLVWRSFARGTIGVPARGMAQIPAQLAADLPVGVLELERSVLGIAPGGRAVETTDGTIDATAVLVATDAPRAAALLAQPTPPMHAVTTWFHAADTPPLETPVLVLDGTGSTPIANSVVLTNAAPDYSSDGRALIATSVLGVGTTDDQSLRTHLSWLYDVDAAAWELIAEVPMAEALPAYPPGSPLRRPARLPSGVFVAGDWRDTPSIQGALVSGRRVAEAVLRSRD